MAVIGKPKDLILWLLSQKDDSVFEIKVYKNRRSKNANAYAWSLVDRIASKVRKSKQEVYEQMLKDYGQSEIVSVLSDIDVSGYFQYYEVAGTSDLRGRPFTHYRVFKGSSEYDTHEMSVLIDGIVQEAKNLGIETLKPVELQRLKDSWG